MNAVHESDSDSTQVENLTATANGNVTLYAVRITKAVLDPDVIAQTRAYNGAEQAFTMDGYTISYQQDGQTAPQGCRDRLFSHTYSLGLGNAGG